METRYKKLVVILCVLICSSCSDFLDRDPHDQLSSGSFWQDRDDFEMALTAIYGFMHGLTEGPWDNPTTGMWAYLLPNWDNITDNSYGQHGYGSSKQIASGDISSTTGGYIEGVYTVCYQGIARINLFLQQLGQYEGTDLPEGEKQTAEAEARFFRAFYYFQLYSLYGDVPLVLEPLTLETQEQPKVDAAEVLEQILTDLDYGIENLNDVPYFENSGHVARSTAQALKARVLIDAAYGNTGVPDLQILTEVRDLCLEIMPAYSLSPVFEDLFQDAGQAGNPEIIFSVNYLASNKVPTYGTDLIYGDWVTVSPLLSFISTFECRDGLPWGVSPLTDPANPLANRDPRLTKTIFAGMVDWGDGKTHQPSNSMPTGYGLKKFLDPGNLPYGYSTLSQQNTVVMRLGEVLLMYAEAQNEIAGPDQTVYEVMGDLRARVDMPPYPAGMSKEQMRERIRHERRIELAFEGLRYFDLKRWHIAGEVLNSVTDGLLPYHWEDRFYHWPLPQSEIDKNHGVLEQNPDYGN